MTSGVAYPLFAGPGKTVKVGIFTDRRGLRIDGFEILLEGGNISIVANKVVADN